jgi:hypothetical protein
MKKTVYNCKDGIHKFILNDKGKKAHYQIILTNKKNKHLYTINI